MLKIFMHKLTHTNEGWIPYACLQRHRLCFKQNKEQKKIGCSHYGITFPLWKRHKIPYLSQKIKKKKGLCNIFWVVIKMAIYYISPFINRFQGQPFFSRRENKAQMVEWLPRVIHQADTDLEINPSFLNSSPVFCP